MSSDIAPGVSADHAQRQAPAGRAPRSEGLRPAGGGRGTYVSFPVPGRPELATLTTRAASRAGALRAAHRGLS